VRRVASHADRIIATDVALEATVERHLHPRPGQMCTIPNGIDLVAASALAGPADGLMLRQRHGLSAGDTVLLSVGRLEFNKGFDLLAAALARATAAGSALSATGWTWVLVGTGPYRRELEHVVSAHGIASHVRFVGRANEGDLHAWYEAASIFVHPTRYEGSSLVTLEAMAHRRPVIATAAGGLPDKVQTGVNGWLVAPNDVEGLAAALTEAVADPRRLTDMGARSREIVEREFAWSVLVDRQIAVYEELLDRRIDELRSHH
jgi:glycosyltransferase involved in cell wall biosynthesis